ncbi:MAG TPA: sigma-70 family RNA polymerase sigma factor [Gemmataceae bacterium]|nr:sigma-70 family RNA polymerase sigma factor [Gemmataceae bacterium]
MNEQQLQDRLSQISTPWTMLRQAHGSQADAVSAAQQQLMQRYGGALYRYLLAALRDPDAADELNQEFAVRFLRGDFRNVNPERGRFRDFLKTSVLHLIVDFHRRRKVRPQQLSPDAPEPADPSDDLAELDRQFQQSWREELLNRSWEALARVERQTGQPFHTVLRFKAKNPDLRSAELAERLGAQMGKPLTAAGVRQTLHRARERFADLLLDEVLGSLDRPTLADLEQELADLGLLEYCRPALERRAGEA